MKMNTTKSKLFSSLLIMALCVTMFAGSTYAWFTDSVTSANNIIRTGNLDVKVNYKTASMDDWAPLEPGTKLFNPEGDALYEPGYTEVVALEIVNAGNLALKYELSTAITEEVAGINVNGDEFKLSDYLKFGHSYIQEGTDVGEIYMDMMLGSRDTAVNGNGIVGPIWSEFNKVISDGVPQQPLLPGSSHMVAFVITMPETVGNEANHDGEHVPSIEFGVNIVATQAIHEDDSFDNLYDKDADYIEYDYQVSDLADLRAAFAEGGNILLTEDIEFDKIAAIEPGKEVYLNLNGKTITVDEDTTSNTLFYVKDGAKLIIDGDGIIDLESVSTMAMFAPYGELVIENGNFIRDKVTTVTSNTTGLFMGAKTTSSNVTINGGYFDSGYYNADAADIEGILAGTIEFVETADDIAKRGVSGDKNAVRVALKDNVSVLLNHSGYGTFKVYGGTFVGANPAWGDEGCMLPTTPNYLRPWSYYQGALLDGQTFNENGIVLPDGYTITMETNEAGIPVYTVNYSK